MAYDVELAQRIRAALCDLSSMREVKMFGGLSFMVNGAMVVSVMSAGDLLVRVDPDREHAYLGTKGAQSAETGAGRAMGKGWLAVEANAITADEDLNYWLNEALDYNERSAPSGRTARKGSRQRKAARAAR